MSGLISVSGLPVDADPQITDAVIVEATLNSGGLVTCLVPISVYMQILTVNSITSSLATLPTSSTDLATGEWWLDGGTLKQVQ